MREEGRALSTADLIQGDVRCNRGPSTYTKNGGGSVMREGGKKVAAQLLCLSSLQAAVNPYEKWAILPARRS